MKIECKFCHSKIELDENDYAPGDVVTLECRRCGEETEVVIPSGKDKECEKENRRTTVSLLRRGGSIDDNASPDSIHRVQEEKNNPEKETLKTNKKGNIKKLYFGVPNDGFFIHPSQKYLAGNSLYCIDLSTDGSFKTFSVIVNPDTLGMHSLHDLLRTACIVKGSKAGKIENIVLTKRGVVSKVSSGWKIVEKAEVSIVTEKKQRNSKPSNDKSGEKSVTGGVEIVENKSQITQPPQQSKSRTQQNPKGASSAHYGTRKVPNGCLILGPLLLIVGGLCYWLLKNNPNDIEEPIQKEMVVTTAEAVVEEPTYYNEFNEDIIDSEWTDTVVAAVAEEVEFPAEDQKAIYRVEVPVASKYKASDAYDVYAAYMTDEKFGDSWAASPIIQNAIREGEVEYFVKGHGDIEGYPLSIDAVRLKNGRFYGRYVNEYNGITKLDINGVFDAHEDLIIKLGHKASASYDETSYWILKFAGNNEDGSLQYSGTWSRKDKSTNLTLRIQSETN